MNLAVLDTSVLIDLHAVHLTQSTAISVLSIAELQHGILSAADDIIRTQRLARLTQLLRIYQPLPVNELVATSYAQLAVATERAGRKARTRHMDLLIAATAHAHHAALVTRNGADVMHLKDIVHIIEL